MYQILQVLGWFHFNKYQLLKNVILIFIASSLICPQKIFAVTVTVDSFPSNITSEIFDIGVTVLGANNGTNYLRIDLYKEGTNNYFGETYNGSDWYSGSTGTNYFPITIQNASASATVQGQIGNPNSSAYLGPGAYKLKIRRYTSSGSLSSNDTQMPVDIQIIYQTPSPTPTAAPTEGPQTSNPTATPIKTATPTATAQATPTIKPKTPTPTPSAESEDVEEIDDGKTIKDVEDLTEEEPKNIVATNEPKVAGVSTSKDQKNAAVLLIIFGSIFLGLGGFSLYKRMKTEYNDKSENTKNGHSKTD